MGATLGRYKLRTGDRIETRTFAWDASAGATGYRLYYGSVSGSYEGYFQTAATSYSVSMPAGPWYFAVTAYNDSGESEHSNEVGGGF